MQMHCGMVAWEGGRLFKDSLHALSLLPAACAGGVANNYISPMLWDDHHLSMWVGAMICGGSLACAIAMASIDKVAESRLKKINAVRRTALPRVSTTDNPYLLLHTLSSFCSPLGTLVLECALLKVANRYTFKLCACKITIHFFSGRYRWLARFDVSE